MKEEYKYIYLIRLSKIGALNRFVKAPTTFLSKVLGVSQQTSSRILIELDSEGLIRRKMINGVSWIKLTDKAVSKLIKLREELDDAFKNPGIIEFRGKVFTGFGEGAYYMRKRAYRKQFYKKLGFDPYPGTLNLKLSGERQIELNRKLRSLKGIKIMGFEDKSRSYGDVYAFKAVINNEVEGAVIHAERTHYDVDVIEVISPYYLRERLGLEDGDYVSLIVFLSETL